MKPYMIGFFAVILLSVASCKKKELPPAGPADKTMEQLTVSPSFHWETANHYDVKLAGPVSGVVFILSVDGTKCYHKGFLTAGTDYSSKISIPSYEEEVQLMLNGIRYTYRLSANRIDHQFK